MYAAIAQLDRVTDYESVGRGFESLSPYQKSRYPFGYLLFCFVRGLELCKCKCPVDTCSFPARRERHHSVTSPFRRTLGHLIFCFAGGTRTFQCECPVDIRLPPARWRQHLTLCPGQSGNGSLSPYSLRMRSSSRWSHADLCYGRNICIYVI